MSFFRSKSYFLFPVFFFIGIFFLCFPLGLIGEVSPTWAPFPKVISTTNPIQDAILMELGGLQLQTTRPILSFSSLPISLNIYTSALPDLPHWLLYQLTGSKEVIIILKCLFSISFLGFIWKNFAPKISEFWTMLYLFLLVSDWNFSFYKYALGNTEIFLQLGWLLCIFALLKWQSNEDGSLYLGWGFGLGFLAKITFLLHLFPLGIGLLFIRPKQLAWKKILLPILLCSLPFLLTLLLFYPQELAVRSHDFFSLQWERIQDALSGKNTSLREQHSNIWLWLFDPLPFFERAYKVPDIAMHWLFKTIGVISGLALIWRKRQCKSIQILGTMCFSQIAILSLIAKDLHHLVIGTPLFWLFWIEVWRQNSDLRWFLAPAILPWFIGNVQILSDSPQTILAVQTPSFSKTSQEKLVDILRQNSVQKLVTMDYEIYGVLEVLTPEIDVLHGWAAISHERKKALPYLLKEASGGHLMVLKSSAAMIYNLQPTRQQLEMEAKPLGLQLTLLEESPPNIWLYSVSER